jgi:hypothetical protein
MNGGLVSPRPSMKIMTDNKIPAWNRTWDFKLCTLPELSRVCKFHIKILPLQIEAIKYRVGNIETIRHRAGKRGNKI